MTLAEGLPDAFSIFAHCRVRITFNLTVAQIGAKGEEQLTKRPDVPKILSSGAIASAHMQRE